MKAVLISIRPKWCELIARGKKTVEVRKTKPKLGTPFKCYIYMTSGDASIPDGTGMVHHHSGGQCVIGEFICDKVLDCRDVPLEPTCLTIDEWLKYTEGHKGPLSAWHISELKIYDTPKPLSEFAIPCREYEKDHPQCGSCDFYHSMSEYPAECGCDGKKPVIRPPQSWCYVEKRR